jgi:hypothetical protein
MGKMTEQEDEIFGSVNSKTFFTMMYYESERMKHNNAFRANIAALQLENIFDLTRKLVKSREKVEVLLSKAVWVKPINPNDPNSAKEASKPKFEGTLMIQADKKVRYELLRKIMYTAGAAQYKIFKLITIKKET